MLVVQVRPTQGATAWAASIRPQRTDPDWTLAPLDEEIVANGLRQGHRPAWALTLAWGVVACPRACGEAT